MKYANIDWQSTEVENSNMWAINVGDNLQFMAVDYLYESMHIPKKDVVYLSINEIAKYRGERLILPLNWSIFDRNWMVDGKISISEYIEPVFLAVTMGASYKEAYWNEENIAFLKKHEPIGCRDINTRNVLRRKGIRAYLNGCLTSLFPKQMCNIKKDKVFFIDAPVELQKYVPKEYLSDAIFMTQQYYFSNEIPVKALKEFVIEHYQQIIQEAKMVVTSRLHIASPCIAFGIPVIMAKKEIDNRFGWLEKYISLYNQDNFSEIDWNPPIIEYEEAKRKIIQLNCSRIFSEWEKWKICRQMDDYYRIDEKPYLDFSQLIGHNWGGLINYIKKKWNKEELYEYAIWGVTASSKEVIEYIRKEFPNAKLKVVIDKYKEGKVFGVEIVKPREVCWEEIQYLFVLSVMASNEAYKICQKKIIPDGQYYLVGDVFMTDNNDMKQ